MGILRPLAEIAAAKAREALEVAYLGLCDTISDDYSSVPTVAEGVEFIPCREGKSLFSPVSRRLLYKRPQAGRLAGFNHGRKVTYYD